DLLLPERRQVINIIIKLVHMHEMWIVQQATGTPLSTMVDDQHIKPQMEQIVGQFRILYVTLNTSRTDDDDPVVLRRAKSDKTYRNVINADKLCFISLVTEVSQWSHGK